MSPKLLMYCDLHTASSLPQRLRMQSNRARYGLTMLCQQTNYMNNYFCLCTNFDGTRMVLHPTGASAEDMEPHISMNRRDDGTRPATVSGTYTTTPQRLTRWGNF